MARGFITLSLVPSSPIAKNGTFEFDFPAGMSATDFAQDGEVLALTGLGNVLKVGAGAFSTAYATDITVTYLDDTTIPAGSLITIQLPLAEFAPLKDETEAAVANLIDKVGDTSGGDESATINANFAALAAKVNLLLELSQARDNVPDDDRN